MAYQPTVTVSGSTTLSGVNNVHVDNFPTVQSVNVQSMPTLNVNPTTSGTPNYVFTTNIPTVQTVGGSVRLTNGATYIDPLTDAQLRATAVPVSLATNTPTLQSGSTTAVTQATGTNLHTVVDSGAVTATLSAETTKVIGAINNLPATADTNSGTKSASTIRVVLATDQPALTNKLLVTPDSVALPANQSVNVSQINSVTPLMGSGVMGTGSQRVTIASDNDPLTIKQATGTNLHTVVDSGTITTVSAVTAITNALPAGSNILGKVGIDQTTIGTTNAITLNKRASTTSLSPNYTANRLAAKATTNVTAATAYLSSLVITTSAAGTAMSITVQNKEGTPKIVYTITSAVVGTVNFSFNEPILMTSGIDIVIGGTTAGTVDVFTTYWQ
jgi:hypothetical protein